MSLQSASRGTVSMLALAAAFSMSLSAAPAQDQAAPPAQPEAEAQAPAPAQPSAGAETPAPEGQAADAASGEMSQPNEDMQAVLDQLQALGAQPIHTLSVEEARSQPTPADAVMAVMEEQGIEPDPALAAVQAEDIAIPGPAGDIAARVYTPEGEGPFPVIVYYHGGGWVIADIDTYDGSARALAAGSNAIVVSSHYRQGPENPFPAPHEDAYAAYEWVVENAHEFNGDAARIAVVGESAGGGLAAHVAIQARDNQATEPLHQVLVYPIAGNDTDTPSYQENAEAAPLGKADMEWFFENAFESTEDTADPRVNLVDRDDLADLPPATVITAEIDPLRSDGQTYAENLEAAGVEVEYQNYEGVAHEFFGMGAVVPEAQEAVAQATSALTEAFMGTAEPTGSTNGQPATGTDPQTQQTPAEQPAGTERQMQEPAEQPAQQQ